MDDNSQRRGSFGKNAKGLFVHWKTNSEEDSKEKFLPKETPIKPLIGSDAQVTREQTPT